MVGKKIKKLRQHKGMFQKELAKELNCNPTLVGKWEKGERIPSSTAITQISNIFGVSADYLLATDIYLQSDSDAEYYISDIKNLNKKLSIHKSVPILLNYDKTLSIKQQSKSSTYETIPILSDYNSERFIYQIKDESLINCLIPKNAKLVVKITNSIQNNDIVAFQKPNSNQITFLKTFKIKDSRALYYIPKRSFEPKKLDSSTLIIGIVEHIYFTPTEIQ